MQSESWEAVQNVKDTLTARITKLESQMQADGRESEKQIAELVKRIERLERGQSRELMEQKGD